MQKVAVESAAGATDADAASKEKDTGMCIRYYGISLLCYNMLSTCTAGA